MTSFDLPAEGALLGYTVAVNRPTGRDPERWEIVGSVHLDRDPAENHRAYCQDTAKAHPLVFLAEERYAVVEVRMAAPVLA